MEEKKNLLTYAGLKKLEEELHDLKVVKRKEVAGKIKEAREQGDLSENAEYDAAKDEQRDIEARIEEIEKILKVYTEDPEVIRCGVEILSITTVPYFLCGIMDLFPGALRGMGHSGVPMILSIIGTVGTRIVWIFWIFPQHRSLYTLFISYPASWFITIVLQVICFVFVRQTVHGQLKGTGKAA